jgi:aspartate aminotransferase
MHPLDQISFGKIVQIRERLLQAQAAGKTVYRFESGDPNFSPAPHVLDAIDAAARAGKTHYIPNDGIPELRKALAEKLRTKNQIPWVTDQNVFMTNGAMHGLYVTFACLLAPGDEVIIPDPMWTEVGENIRLAGGITVGIPLRAEENFEYRPSEIAARITPKTKAIFLNTPHNPTGAVLSESTLREIIDIAKRHDLWIVSDEAYEDVIYAPAVHHSIAALAPEYANKIISIYSFSKSHAMSGLRIGYVVTCNPVLLERIPKLLRCTINGVNSLAQWAAVAAVTGPQDQLTMMRDEYLVRRDILIKALEGIDGIRPFTPRGSFFVWAELEPSIYKRLNVADADGLSNLLAERGVGSAPGDAFGLTCEHAIRFSFSCATSMVEEGAVVLRSVLTAE